MSAPVGVADLIERLEKHAAAWPGVYASDRQNVALLREAATALAQQPAAVDGAIVDRVSNAVGRWDCSEHDSSYYDELARVALAAALAAQPGGSDNDR